MKHAHYLKEISHLKTLDVYRVCQLFDVTDPAIQHAVKKLLCAGQRGIKTEAQDVQEAIDTLTRYQAMQQEDSSQPAPAQPARAEELQADDGGHVLSLEAARAFGIDLQNAHALADFVNHADPSAGPISALHGCIDRLAGYATAGPTGGMPPQEPVDDGWIECEGGRRPVDGDVRVDVKLRSGGVMEYEKASRLTWGSRKNPQNDIIAYRVVTA